MIINRIALHTHYTVQTLQTHYKTLHAQQQKPLTSASSHVYPVNYLCATVPRDSIGKSSCGRTSKLHEAIHVTQKLRYGQSPNWPLCETWKVVITVNCTFMGIFILT